MKSTFIRMTTRITMMLFVVGVIAASNMGLVSAANMYWNGGGDDSTWLDDGNWSLARAPLDSDSLIFNVANSGVASKVVTNDVEDLLLTKLTFTGTRSTGYKIAGNSIQLAGHIRDQNTGNSANRIAANIWSNSDLSITTVQNAHLYNEARKYTLENSTLYLRSFDHSLNYVGLPTQLPRINVFAEKIVVSGDRSGKTQLGQAIVWSPTHVGKDGYLFLHGTKIYAGLYVTSTGTVASDTCTYMHGLWLEGYHRLVINGAPNGAGCGTYGKLNVTENVVNITGARLVVGGALASGYAPAKGAEYTLIVNHTSHDVIGTYKGLPEGSKFKIGTYTFQITYKGGVGGNDVVITRL